MPLLEFPGPEDADEDAGPDEGEDVVRRDGVVARAPEWA
jgi:hypothetical protein